MIQITPEMARLISQIASLKGGGGCGGSLGCRDDICQIVDTSKAYTSDPNKHAMFGQNVVDAVRRPRLCEVCTVPGLLELTAQLSALVPPEED